MPQTPEEIQAAIAPYEMPVSLVLSGISHMLETAGVKPLSPKELADGSKVWAGVCYEHQAVLNFTTLAIFWTLNVSVPRAVMWFDERKKQERRESMKPEHIATAAAEVRAASSPIAQAMENGVPAPA